MGRVTIEEAKRLFAAASIRTPSEINGVDLSEIFGRHLSVVPDGDAGSPP